MNKRVGDKIRELKTNEAALAVRSIQAANSQSEATGAAMLLGAAGALDATARMTASQSVRAMQRFRDTKGHESLGFSNFKEFLNKSPHSPMSYDQFNDREKLLEREGDVIFNLLSTMRVPADARKQLASGSIQIEEEAIVIAGERIRADDKPRILEVIKTLADTTVSQAKKLEKGKEDNLKWKKEAQAAKRSTAARRGDSPAHDQALLDVIIAMGRYAEEVSKLSEVEVSAVRDEAQDLLAQQMLRIRTAHRFPDAPQPVSGYQPPSILAGSDLDDVADEI